MGTQIMRIAVTTQDFRTVTGHAGRARRFLIYDVQPGADPVEVERLYLPERLAMHGFHGPGPHPVDDVDVVLSKGFGEGFFHRMASRGIIAATTEITDPAQAVKGYLECPPTGAEALAGATCDCKHGDDDAHAHAHAHAHSEDEHHHDSADCCGAPAMNEDGTGA